MSNTNHLMNQNPVTSNPKNPNKPYLILLGFLSFLIITLGIADIVIYTIKNNSVNDNTNNTTPLTTFENLTKEEALAFLQAQTDITGTLPKNYVGEEISNAVITNGSTIVSDLDLIYSYDTIEELKEMAVQKKYNSLNFLITDDLTTDDAEEYNDNNLEITEYDYYAIVSPKQVEGRTSCDNIYNGCDSLLSFKRNYLDYNVEEATPNSYNDVFYLNTQDPDIINYLLRVYTFFSRIGFGGHGNIYSYSFEEQDDKYILTVYNIGAGINVELLKNPDNYTNNSEMYGINLYLRRFAADKSDGRIYTIPTETGVTEDVKSFPITEEELRSLPWYSN